MSPSWSAKQSVKLIACWKDEPELYDPKHRDFKKKPHDAYKRICQKLKSIKPSVAASDVGQKIRNLRVQFKREVMIYKKTKEENVLTNGKYVPKLWCFDLLQFLYEAEHGEQIPCQNSRNLSDLEEKASNSFPFHELWSKEEAIKLIKLYEKEHVLYDLSHRHCHNRLKIQRAYQRLLEALKKVKPDLTVGMIKGKLRNLRVQYNKEYVRFRKAIEMGEDTSKYVPSLWCFDLLRFLGKCKSLTANYESSQSPPKISTVIKKSDPFDNVSNVPQYLLHPELERPPTPESPESLPESFSSQSTDKSLTRSSNCSSKSINKFENPENSPSESPVLTADNQSNNKFKDHDYTMQPQPIYVDSLPILQNKTNQRQTTVQNRTHETIEIHDSKEEMFGKYVATLLKEIRNPKTYAELTCKILQMIHSTTASKEKTKCMECNRNSTSTKYNRGENIIDIVMVESDVNQTDFE